MVQLPRVALPVIAVLLLLLPSRAAAQADAGSVVEAFAAARNSQDVEAMLAVFADDAVVTDRSGKTYAGKADIRSFLLLRNSRFRATTLALHRVANNRVSWTERVTTQVSTFEFTVEAVVEGGKIKALIYGDGGGVARTDAIPESGSRFPAAWGMATVAAVLSLSLVVISAGLPRRRWGGSPLEGQLVSGLRQWAETRGRSPET